MPAGFSNRKLYSALVELLREPLPKPRDAGHGLASRAHATNGSRLKERYVIFAG